MIPQEIIKKIRKIQIYTSRAVDSSFAGQYESVFKGKGMQFDEVREYIPGDDIRNIDWNVTARTGKPHIKRFVEEREMTVIFAVDLSASGNFGTVEKTKSELAAEFCAVLAFAALKNNDKVGLLIFTDTIEHYIPPKKGSKHILRLIRELLCFKSKGKETDISQALEYIGKVTKKKATVFLLSDFFDDGFKRQLNLLNKKHDVIAVNVSDPTEEHFPKVGLIEMEDAESGEKILIDANSKKIRNKFFNDQKRKREILKDTLRSAKVDQINIKTSEEYISKVAAFFKMRSRRY